MDRLVVALGASSGSVAACSLPFDQEIKWTVQSDKEDVVMPQQVNERLKPFVVVQNVLHDQVVAGIGIGPE